MLFGPTDGSCRQQGPYFLPPRFLICLPPRIGLPEAPRSARRGTARGAAPRASPHRRPVAGSLCPVLGPGGPASGHQRYARAHRPPAHRLPPSAPGPHGGGPLAADRRCSGAAPAACAPLRRHQRAWPVPVPARLAWAVAACARPSLRRRPGPPLASLRPLRGRLGRRRHSVLPVALGLLWVVLRTALRATAGSLPALLRLRLGGSPQDGPARALPSLVPRSVGRLGGLTGSAPPARGLSRSPEGTAL